MRTFLCLISLLLINHMGYGDGAKYKSLKKQSSNVVIKFGQLAYSYPDKWAKESVCVEEKKRLKEMTTDKKAVKKFKHHPYHDAVTAWLYAVENGIDQLSACLKHTKDNSCKENSDFGKWMGEDRFAQCYCRGEKIICPSSLDDPDCNAIYDSGADGLYEKCPCSEAANLGITCED